MNIISKIHVGAYNREKKQTTGVEWKSTILLDIRL